MSCWKRGSVKLRINCRQRWHWAAARKPTFPVMEIAEQSQYLMSEKEEILSSELSLSGANAWSKLQGTVTSQKTVEFELDGEVQTLPMPA
jgi:hypothetical protein